MKRTANTAGTKFVKHYIENINTDAKGKNPYNYIDVRLRLNPEQRQNQ
jgi:hypothetical protein